MIFLRKRFNPPLWWNWTLSEMKEALREGNEIVHNVEEEEEDCLTRFPSRNYGNNSADKISKRVK